VTVIVEITRCHTQGIDSDINCLICESSCFRAKEDRGCVTENRVDAAVCGRNVGHAVFIEISDNDLVGAGRCGKTGFQGEFTIALPNTWKIVPALLALIKSRWPSWL